MLLSTRLDTKPRAKVAITHRRDEPTTVKPQYPKHAPSQKVIPLAIGRFARLPHQGSSNGAMIATLASGWASAIVSSCFGSALGSGGDFQAERFCRCRGPGFSAEWSPSVDAAANGYQLRVRLRSIHMLQPAGTATNWPCRQQFFFSRRFGVPATSQKTAVEYPCEPPLPRAPSQTQ